MEKTSLGGVDHHYSQSLIRLSMIERVVNRILFTTLIMICEVKIKVYFTIYACMTEQAHVCVMTQRV